jgi:hypothetical protein
MIYIYTETFKLWPRLKRVIKRFVRTGLGGPKGVEQSLLRGLKELGREFAWNRRPTESGGVACVLSGVETLKWVIAQKNKDNFSKLLAGPNIVVTPFDHDRLILSKAIDAYLVPAQWSIDWWTKLAPEMMPILRVWPAGVEDRGELVNKSGKILVFQKNAPEELLKFIISNLNKVSENFEVIRYGQYTKDQYFKLLAQSKGMIYLSQSESQGLALHEAWMAGVPTLVWDRGFMTYQNLRFESPGLSAPYLTDACGMIFKGSDGFSRGLPEFLSSLDRFHPRPYSLRNFTDKISAEKLLTIIESL